MATIRTGEVVHSHVSDVGLCPAAPTKVGLPHSEPNKSDFVADPDAAFVIDDNCA